jgi:hypothetical protein
MAPAIDNLIWSQKSYRTFLMNEEIIAMNMRTVERMIFSFFITRFNQNDWIKAISGIYMMLTVNHQKLLLVWTLDQMQLRLCVEDEMLCFKRNNYSELLHGRKHLYYWCKMKKMKSFDRREVRRMQKKHEKWY